MERVGKIVEKQGDYATVLMRKHSSCENCGRCGGILGGPDLKDCRVIVKNTINADVGQSVIVEADDGRLLLMAFVMYLMPVIALVIGIFGTIIISEQIGFGSDNYIFASVIGFILMGAVFAAIKVWDRQKKDDERYRPVIVSLSDEPVETEET